MSRRRAVVLQRFIGRHFHFSIPLVTKPRALQFHLPVGEHHPPLLGAVPADLSASLARRPRSGDLLGAQQQNGLDGLPAHGTIDLIDRHSGLGDQFDQRKQQLPVGLGELLDARSRGFLFSIDDMVSSLHGGGVLSKDCFGESVLPNRLRHRRSTFN